LAEGDASRQQPRIAQQAGLAVDDLGAFVPAAGMHGGQHGAGEHVAGGGALVAEDAVVEQVDGAALVHAQQRRALHGAGGRLVGGAGFAQPQEGGQVGKAHLGVQLAVFAEQRRTQLHDAKAAAALPVHGGADAALFALHHLAQAREAVGDGVFAPLDADPSAAHLVGDGGGGPGAQEGIEHKLTSQRGHFNDVPNEHLRLWRPEGRFARKQRLDFSLRILRMACFCVRPDGARNQASLHFGKKDL
jgi:hypothetical protein